jgi:hypothetical protein
VKKIERVKIVQRDSDHISNKESHIPSDPILLFFFVLASSAAFLASSADKKQKKHPKNGEFLPS